MMLQSFASNYTHLLNQFSIHTNLYLILYNALFSASTCVNWNESWQPELLAFMTFCQSIQLLSVRMENLSKIMSPPFHSMAI